MIGLLTRTPVLWALFVLTVALFVGFNFWTPAVGGMILDTVGPVDEVQALLASMTDAQKASHFRMTLGLDMIFPLIYGGLFIGLIFRNFDKAARWLAIPAFAVIPIDLAENTIQLMALQGNESLLGAKALLTPAKSLSFLVAALIALAGLVIATVRRLRG